MVRVRDGLLGQKSYFVSLFILVLKKYLFLETIEEEVF